MPNFRVLDPDFILRSVSFRVVGVIANLED
jgi:hypothetical protein